MARGKETSTARALAALVLGGGSLVLAALVTIGQLYVWLKTGHWPELTLATVVLPISSGSNFSLWLANPTSWFGLHSVVKVLMDFPLWVWIVACASGTVFGLLRD